MKDEELSKEQLDVAMSGWSCGISIPLARHEVTSPGLYG